MHIDQLLQQVSAHIANKQQAISCDGLRVPKEWSQGRTLFGGISAAMAYAAVKQQVADDRVMRSFSCNFVGPIEVDMPFSIEVDVLRQGKNATQAYAKIIQDDKVALLCQVSFGVARSSKVAVMNHEHHAMELPQKAKFIPQIPKITPKFLRHFDLSIEQGSMPFAGSKLSDIHGWMRFKEAPQQITDAHLICLIDSWPPTVLQMLRWPAPASTMSWNVEFLHPHKTFSPSDWFAYQAKTRQAADGYAHTEANIWDQQGQLIALSRQTVGIFD
ncbi:thioesterase family protein [Aliiglaciecola sp. LCG003]|uniref:acyl-CoA thioesterase n=1 Tax=Aliiglaciecola sp. LCG003 TaxID=3053655 RepID=UPI0025729A71|nr:thioesterase family protein [Aliiglaciecola sp. LCG003]WJG07921.1 thioesterase family protein [Aliiglaciecola sp. LCG003]